MTELLKPYDYQQEIIDRFKDEDSAALFLEPGCGKTLITANLMRHKFNTHGEIFNTIIFCPIIVLENWKRELLMSTRLKPSMIGVVMGSPKKRMKILNDPKHKIFIINYEAMRAPAIRDRLIELSPRIVVCDESHMIKTPKLKTKMGRPTILKNVIDVSASSLYRYALTGSPMENAQDLWAQYYFLDRGETFGDKYFHFKSKYFVDKNAGMRGQQNYFPNWVFIESLEKEVNEKLARTASILKAEDCLTLPDLVEQTVNVELSTEQKKHYKEIKNDLITFIDNNTDNPLVVKNALTKVLRLNEVLSGYMKLEDGTVFNFKENPRLDALMQLLDMTKPHKIIIFSVFRKNYSSIRKALEKKGIKYVEIHGGITPKQKILNVDTFNNMDNDIRVCISHPRSGGVGVNLKAARYTAFYTRDYSLKDFTQSRARNFRAGSIDIHKKITHYQFVAPNTIDEKILEAIRNKKKMISSLLDIRNLLEGE